MIKKTIRTVVLCLGIALFGVSSAGATAISYYAEGGILGNAPAYDWWYGCSPTSAGMMMGYYDNNGYSGFRYDNLVPGGTAELSTFSGSTGWNALANNVIASQGHVNDFYKGGYLASGDDATSQLHNFNSLADFMGTSQDSVSNVNGSTTFWYYTDGAKFTARDAIKLGVSNRDGMYGILEYMRYAGYDAAQLYTQHIYSTATPLGFSFADYKAEINAGRVVMLHVEGHSMFGYGYGDGELVYLNDTWSSGPHTMTWGGSYPYVNTELDMWGVTAMVPTGGSPVPVPATIFLLAPGLILMVRFRRQFTGRG